MRVRHLVALLLPLCVTVVVPGLIVNWGRESPMGWLLPGPLGALPLFVGGVLIAAGLYLLTWTVSLFATAGRGTLAPWDPTRQLVVHGPYRHVRNPMISGVTAILLGETALVGSVQMLAWCGAFFLTNAVYIPLVEEPGLVRRFGADYVAYKQNVPRWIPRLRPWRPQPPQRLSP